MALMHQFLVKPFQLSVFDRFAIKCCWSKVKKLLRRSELLQMKLRFTLVVTNRQTARGLYIGIRRPSCTEKWLSALRIRNGRLSEMARKCAHSGTQAAVDWTLRKIKLKICIDIK